MKKYTVLIVLCLACSRKEKENVSEWKELESFHKLMAAAFHPLDSGNIEPAKKLASQLADEADRWASANLPDRVNNSETKKNLEELKSLSRSLANDVSKGEADDKLKEELTYLHERFHQIMEAWEGGDHHGERENHDHNDDQDDDDDDDGK